MVKKTKLPDNTIALNRKARHDYLIEQTFEAGLVLQGWEVKSLRAGRCQISESHIIIKRGEAWLLGSQVTPLPSASTHMENDPSRTRKLLLNRNELDKLIGHVEQKGYTLVPLKLYWKKGRAKLDLALAKGKKAHDKRAALKERDWQREKSRLGKN